MITPDLGRFKEIVEREKEGFSQRAREQIITLMLGGFGLVAALAWNEAIQALFQEIFGSQRNSLWAKFVYAVFVTLIVVFVGTRLNKLFQHKEDS